MSDRELASVQAELDALRDGLSELVLRWPLPSGPALRAAALELIDETKKVGVEVLQYRGRGE